jgi:uncharacterized protein (TIGR02231 family)
MALEFRASTVAVPLLCIGIWLPFGSVVSAGVSQVTVYPDRASVTRVHEAEVLAGEGLIRIHPLPPLLDPASLRVRAEGLNGLQLRHAETRVVHGRELANPEERQLTEDLQAAQDARRGLSDGRRAQELKLEFIQRLSDNAGLVEPSLPLDQWHRAWGMIGDGALDTLEGIARLDRDLRDIDAEIDRIQRQLNALRTDQRDTLEAAIHYQASAAGTARITLEYEISGASWAPLYEARLDTQSARLEWVQRAEVRQNTGEAWDDVVLHLSTARPALGGRLPELRPWFLDIAPPPRPSPRRETNAMDMMAAPAPMLESAILETTGFTSHYRVPGRVTLPPDNREQRILLARGEQQAELSARAVPALSPHVYLFAQTVFEGDTPLLPGPVSLFQDGQLVGQTGVGSIAPGAPLRLAFGVDDRIEISRTLDRDSLGREGLLRRQQRLERSYRITIENRHDRALPVTVLDRMPVPRDERIRVDLTPATLKPSERDVDGRLGVLAWNFEVAAGAREELRFGYTVSWPEDVDGVQGLDPASR